MIAVPNYVSPKEYLVIERQSQIRHEYRRGLVYAMAGGTDNHDRLTFNFLKAVDNPLGDASGCRFYSGNVKVNVECRRRTATGTWETTVDETGDQVTLTSIDLTFAIGDLYRGLDGCNGR
jgi:Uma2 family endonuclease